MNVELTDNNMQENCAANENNAEVTTDTTETGEFVSESSEAAALKKVYKSKSEIIERVKEIAHSDEHPQKGEIDYLKTIFYKLHFAEREADMKHILREAATRQTTKCFLTKTKRCLRLRWA